MSNDLEYRPSPPPDFGVDDDENKDDDQMFKSANLPVTDDIPLSEDDESPFGDADDKPNPSTTSVILTESTPIVQESHVLNNNINSDNSTNHSVDNQQSTTNEKSNEVVPASAPKPQPLAESKIEITVSDPTKVGEGISSYMTYRITTKTSLRFFKATEFSVNRRFSDFLGLHNKLVQKHLQVGIILPSPPEKDSLVMAKVKISKDENIPTDFIDRRRSQLERYLNRLARHERLVQDPDFRDFIEMSSDLPRSSSTQALSGASVLRVLSNLSNSVTKLTTKTNEQDQWFDEKHTFILDLHTNFKQLYNYFNNLFTQRKESGQALKQLATALNHLATIEEHTLLSSALIELANVDEKLEQISLEHSCKEYSVISELIKEYVSLLEMVQLVFQERIKIHQQWLTAEDTLKKKRETKIKLEQTSKNADKLPTMEMEINEWEGKVERGKEDFERISTTIKQELEVFEQIRIDDFRNGIQNYLKLLLEEQEKILEVWENYLPEANKINV